MAVSASSNGVAGNSQHDERHGALTLAPPCILQAACVVEACQACVSAALSWKACLAAACAARARRADSARSARRAASPAMRTSSSAQPLRICRDCARPSSVLLPSVRRAAVPAISRLPPDRNTCRMQSGACLSTTVRQAEPGHLTSQKITRPGCQAASPCSAWVNSSLSLVSCSACVRRPCTAERWAASSALVSSSCGHTCICCPGVPRQGRKTEGRHACTIHAERMRMPASEGCHVAAASPGAATAASGG